MAKNKNKKQLSLVPTNQSDAQQAHSLFEQYHVIAGGLHSSSDQQQAEVALEDITGEPEGIQLALLKSLARTRDTDAADVLLALNVLSPLKTVRKEARRGLLQLEQSKISPRWEPVLEHASPIQSVQVQGNPPRFWKGYVTDSRDVDEVGMILMWEQGEDYREVRTMGLLLEFSYDGVKDFFTQIESKRQALKLIDQNTQSGQYISCSLAKAKRLILEALDVNQKAHSRPFRDFSLHTSLVNELILEAPDVGEETEEEREEENDEERVKALDLAELGPIEVIINYVEAWSSRNYTLAYGLLSGNSPLRQKLAAEAWAERREQWSAKAKPARMRPGFVREHESAASKLWLPDALSRRKAKPQEFEVGWSLELAGTADMAALPELLKPTIVFKETGRSWFWGTFALVEEDDGWRIQNITDQSEQTRSLSSAQIKKRIEDLTNEAQKVTARRPPGNIEDIDDVTLLDDISSVLSISQTILTFNDVLLSKGDTPEKTFLEAFSLATSTGNYERAIAYLDAFIERFPAQRHEMLFVRAATWLEVIDGYTTETGDEADQRISQFNALAEADLRESLRIRNTTQAHILLAQLLWDSDDEERYDEAEAHLHEAEALGTNKDEALAVGSLLGNIAVSRKQFEQALNHFQRVAEIDPEFRNIQHSIGACYLALNKIGEAEASFKKAVAVDPEDFDAYDDLVSLYLRSASYMEARTLLEQGLLANPDEPHLMALLASVYYEQGDMEQANEILQEAEEIDSDEPIVQEYREIMNRLIEERNQTKR